MRRVLFAAVVFVAGCVVMPPTPPGSPEFQQGWVSGCSAGYAAAGDPYSNYDRDAAAYRQNIDYRDGWDGGFTQCRGSYEAMRR